MRPSHDYVIEELRRAYEGSAAKRDEMPKALWKLEERAVFLGRLRAEDMKRLLEVGSGTGQDSAYFQENGLDVVATDLSPEMVERCRAKGLEAHVMDFLTLDFPPASFDAAYALNCLLHVPNAEFPAVLAAIRQVVRPGGLCFIGVYGGEPFEGVWPDDLHDPPRFFSFRNDDQMRTFVSEVFEIVDFHVIDSEASGDVAVNAGAFRFQSLTLRVPD